MPRGAPPLPFEALTPYYNGCFNTTVALKGRATNLPSAARRAYLDEINRYQQMISEFRDGVAKTVEIKQGQTSS
jgi:hypothetical protein